MSTPPPAHRRFHYLLSLAWTLLLAFCFAQVEIAIEGPHGWASALPTWRIERHWLLDLFWGGRPMTGYHAWVFPFIALSFHWPLVYAGRWSWRDEAHVLGCLVLFWLVEDFLWFVCNPAFGIARFGPAWIPWHKHWWGPAPADYWIFSVLAIALLVFAYPAPSRAQPQPTRP